MDSARSSSAPLACCWTKSRYGSTKAENYQAVHVLLPRRGVAVHINAFNFPSWGLWEKAAVALLAGVPVFAKPASATALLTHAMVKDVIEARVLPEGSLSLLCGSAGALLSVLASEDVVAFPGSADTAACVRGDPNVIARNLPVNIEADSINAAVLAPGAAAGSAAYDAFLREVVREMTVKAGQKCTAIRRIFVPAGKADAVADALAEKLKGTKIGDPRQADTRMGALVARGHPALGDRGGDRLRRHRCSDPRRHRQEQIGIRRADLAQAQGRGQRAGGAR